MGLRTNVGSIVCSNLVSQPSAPMAGLYSAMELTIGQVLEVLKIDNIANQSKRYIEYRVQVEDGQRSMAIITCLALDAFGSENNFQEAILNPVTGTSSVKTANQSNVADLEHFKNGATVLVGFIHNIKGRGVILGGIQHPALNLELDTTPISEFVGKGSSTSRTESVTKLPTLNPAFADDGNPTSDPRILGEFNGLRWNINKDGELTIIYQGPKDSKGNLVSPDVQPTILKITKDGEFFILDNLDQEIKISRKDQKIIISDGQKDQPNIITLDRANNKVTVQSPSKIEVIAPDVRIGSSTANQQAVLGNLLMTLFNGHKHEEHDGPSTKGPSKQMSQEQLSKNVKISKE